MTLQRLRDIVAGTVPNAIMPLFWQKGGPVEVVREEMERIADAGIGAVILEARPHPQYLEDGWWRDVDAVLEIARRRGMTVWFFDDDTFPTGHAGGAVEAAPAELHRHFLSERHTDAVGPARGASFIVERRALWGPDAAREPGELLRVLAFRRAEDSDELTGDPVDLTDRIVDGVLHWDIPDGWWRVFFLEVGEGGSARHAQHIDYLNAASTQLLIDTVYERIHERYADEFGATIAGFFSDEPGLYNDPDTFDFDSRLGKAVPLPWNDDVAARLSERLGQDAVPLLPLLWMPGGERGREVRYAFMDTVSRLYSENFGRRLGDWCRAHGVEYIGHVIEDNGSHARLGPGAGHYFRAMAGQDMAGVDIIGGQVVPGFSRGPFGNIGGAADGEFFHFGLAKLASSAAHLDPLKQGRAMCETIGAYGWYAGLRLFTWLTNHLLVRGVTHVVPHAFSPAPFPDPDCPPHFYARGNNPQYPLQHLLSAYTNRLSHLLQSGGHVAPFAVLYHADAEWLGDAMPFERPLGLLMEAQLDADVVPADVLLDAGVDGSTLTLGGETYDALIVPGSAYLPAHVALELLRLDDAGVPVVFVGSVPDVSGPRVDGNALKLRFRPVSEKGLVPAVQGMSDRAVRLDPPCASVRVLRRDAGDADVFMVVNESVRDTVRATATLPRAGEIVAFDAATGTLTEVPGRVDGRTTSVSLELGPGESVVLLVGSPTAWEGLPVRPAAELGDAVELVSTWTVATATASEPAFSEWGELDGLRPLSDPDLLPRFSGTARYTASFDSRDDAAEHVLDLGQVFELASVRLNGVDLGSRIAPPYVFDVPAGVLAGRNTMEVEVTNTLAKAQPDFFSAFAQQDPSGLLGPVTIAARTPLSSTAETSKDRA
ncbi:glycosylhydrolase-like jelly roll fold domain-containing protein [Leifsonia sp. RAF41]|uniref:glycosylhydrolase-like jelly roll fold domain-containing protein n=1 Tax=Leifsonia sp. RAF41 TaxID=3233056 RepID=UPI003F9B07DB